MACGACGKGRAGTAAVKERRRSSAGSAMVTSQTISPPTSTPSTYTNRYQEYLRTQNENRRKG